MTAVVRQEFDQKNMIFRKLGPSGLRVPLFSFGGWLTIGDDVVGDPVKDIMKTAFDAGVNMFDTAEAYAAGNSEVEMGRVIKEMGWRRTDLVITTKLFWGAGRKGPNDQGLSRKHIIEGTKESLERLQMDYVDVIFAHRCDITVPMEEIVRAFNYVIEKGQESNLVLSLFSTDLLRFQAFYWGTSEWTAQQIEEAFHVATRLNLVPPIAEQCQHNLFYRERPEREYAPLYRNYGIKTTVFSALASGLLTGKYNDGIPPGSRLDTRKEVSRLAEELKTDIGKSKIAKVKKLAEFAEKELGTTVQALSLAWVAANPNTATVILGAKNPEQLKDDLKALEIVPKLTPEVIKKINKIIDTDPMPEAEYRQKL